THLFTFDYTWDVPFARWFNVGGGNRLVNGWRLMGIASAHSGTPIYITSGRDTYGNGDATQQRPDYVGGQPIFVDGYRDSANHQFLNPAAFEDPCTLRG